jgi:hypothetical protein
MDTPTFEQIDAAFRGLDIPKQQAALKQLSAQGAGVSTSSVISQICPIYKAVRPFLQAAANLPFILNSSLANRNRRVHRGDGSALPLNRGDQFDLQ